MKTTASLVVAFLITLSRGASIGTDHKVDPLIGDRAVCDFVLLEPSARISSPNYPDDYDNKLNCSWLVAGRENAYFSLRFDFFQTEDQHDILTVYDGSTTSAPILQRASGSVAPFIVFSSSNTMLVTFTSDFTSTFKGFTSTYETFYRVTTTGTTSGTTTLSPGSCGRTLTAPSGTFSSPYYPNSYINDLFCQTLIRVSTGSRIRFDFTFFNTEPDFDVVTIYDGRNTSFPVLGNYAGFTSPPPILSTGNELFLSFITDESVVRSGWEAVYIRI